MKQGCRGPYESGKTEITLSIKSNLLLQVTVLTFNNILSEVILWWSDEGELAILTGQIRRWLSLEGVRSQARCLLERVGALGAGAAAAAKRRGWALQEEARMSKERYAQQLCLAQGHYALRRGQFLL